MLRIQAERREHSNPHRLRWIMLAEGHGLAIITKPSG
jgi:hypothetical protein